MMRRPIQSTDRFLDLTPNSSRLSSTLSISKSVRSLQTEVSAGTPAGPTSARLWATSSSGSNPSVPLCGRSFSDPLPSGGLTKNSSSFSTPTVTLDVTQSVNHQLAPLCQRSGALFTADMLRCGPVSDAFQPLEVGILGPQLGVMGMGCSQDDAVGKR